MAHAARSGDLARQRQDLRASRAADDGDYRGGEQFLHMMRAKSLAEWKEAMRIRSRFNSNFTYADRAGNILYVWNASIPSLPHPSGGDSVAIPAHGTSDVWTRYVDFDSLPQVLNPKGGYVQNSNDPPYHTNLRAVLDRSKYPANFPEPRVGLRTQMALTLIDTPTKLSLEDVIALKHSYRMLLADRVKDDLIAAVRASNPDAGSRERGGHAREVGERGRAQRATAPCCSRTGGTSIHAALSPDSLYAETWTRGETGVDAARSQGSSACRDVRLPQAVAETTKQYGDPGIAWGDVHRVRMGKVDVPVGGCSGFLGCFRVLNFANTPDGKRSGDRRRRLDSRDRVRQRAAARVLRARLWRERP